MLNEEQKKLRSRKGYFERFFALCPKHKVYRKAYEALEHEYYAVYGENRYSSYQSFRVHKHRYLKQLRKNVIKGNALV